MFPAPVSVPVAAVVATEFVAGPVAEEALFTVGAVILPELDEEAIATAAAWDAMSPAEGRLLPCRLLVGPFCVEELTWLLRWAVGGKSPLVWLGGNPEIMTTQSQVHFYEYWYE